MFATVVAGSIWTSSEATTHLKTLDASTHVVLTTEEAPGPRSGCISLNRVHNVRTGQDSNSPRRGSWPGNASETRATQRHEQLRMLKERSQQLVCCAHLSAHRTKPPRRPKSQQWAPTTATAPKLDAACASADSCLGAAWRRDGSSPGTEDVGPVEISADLCSGNLM